MLVRARARCRPKSLNGFTGTVTLACAVVGSPTGVTCTVPASTTTSATGISFTATVNASADAAAGNYTITVTGVNSGQQRMYSFTAQVKDFTLAPSTGAITIPQPPPGQSSSVALPVTITGLNGFNTSTAFACTGQPAGMTCAFAPASHYSDSEWSHFHAYCDLIEHGCGERFCSANKRDSRNSDPSATAVGYDRWSQLHPSGDADCAECDCGIFDAVHRHLYPVRGHDR